MRFDPDQIGALATAQLNPLAKLPGGQNHDDAAPVQLDTPPQQPLPLRDLPTAEAENFSRAILAGWPQTTEEVALQKAKLFFPDNKVPKDWFLKKFRVIRGPKTRGKQPKTRY